MNTVKVTQINGKTIHFFNSEYYYNEGEIIIKEYDEDEFGGYHLACTHHIDESEVASICYE